jgi:hypothetical protein
VRRWRKQLYHLFAANIQMLKYGTSGIMKNAFGAECLADPVLIKIIDTFVINAGKNYVARKNILPAPKRKRESRDMDIRTIKNKMLKWRDWYGQDIVQENEIKKAKTKKGLYLILKTHYRFLEDQNIEALRDVDNFIKKLGLST